MFGGESEMRLADDWLPLLLLGTVASYYFRCMTPHILLFSHEFSIGIKCLSVCYELFRVHPLKSLTKNFCLSFVKSLAGCAVASNRILNALVIDWKWGFCQNDVIYCGRQLSLLVHTLNTHTRTILFFLFSYRFAIIWHIWFDVQTYFIFHFYHICIDLKVRAEVDSHPKSIALSHFRKRRKAVC